MTVKASAAGALMLAAGLFVSIAGPSPATAAGSESAAASKSESATSGKSAKSSSRYLEKKRYVYRKFTRTASKSAETGKAAEKDVADASAGVRPAMTESIANANAQMNSADAARGNIGDSAKAMSQAMAAKANTILLAAADNQADGQAPAEGAAVAAPDQLNDVDRVLQESQTTQTAATQTVAMAQAKPAQQEYPAQASNSDSLDKTSLIGKIFIAFGTLLTMASAARMFMA
jgi:hypothetical protein